MRKFNRLTARQVAAAASGRRHADGGGLYLNTKGGRRWEFQFSWQGRERVLGLGSANLISLATARQLADAARAQYAAGLDPIAEKRKASSAREPLTFGHYAEQVIAKKEAELHNPKSAAQWRMTLTQYAKPLSNKSVAEITTEDVLQVLKPLWSAKPETASRLRGRIEAVIDAAIARGDRTAANPARWRGHLKHLLPERRKLSRGHHAAMPYGEVPTFMGALHEQTSIAARALEFLVLTVARSGEVRHARWSEINWDDRLWVVPAERMKARREHRVPLSRAATAVLRQMKALGAARDRLIFPGLKAGKPLSDMTLTKLLRRLKVDVTVHGFRSSFRDWSAERTNFSHEVCEAALAHAISNKAEAAYRRGDMLEKRRALMTAWATYCETLAGAKVLPLARSAGAAQ